MNNNSPLTYYRWIFITAVIPYVIGMQSFIPAQIMGLNWGGFSWTIILLVGVIRISLHPGAVTMPVWVWLPWFIYITVQWFFDRSFYGLQATLQYMVFPVTGVAASTYIYTDEVLLKLKKWMSVFMLFIFLMMGLFVAKISASSMGSSTIMTLVIFGALLLSDFWVYRNRKSAWLFSVILLFPLLTVSRMGILMMLVIAAFHFANRTAANRLLIGMVALCTGLMVFFSASFQKKTFFSGKGDLEQLSADNGNFNTNGRSKIWSLAEKGISDHPWWGSGSRADLWMLMDNNYKLKELHNDYIAVLYNSGRVGLCCLLFGFLMQFWLLYRCRQDVTDAYTAVIYYAALTVFLSWIGFMFTDNALKYATYFGNFHFCLIGIAFARLSYQRDHLKTVLV
ncbi:O-antigen ligase family protein [Chitinophaga sp. G-6-1-13]|uniref:O-antigen ligase family protein n=1 Tax=Chitinophaga fulva TaxID=2728842 RepID=A0A848GHH3_9BACT|nr:O-antigen ligase family protein [Chitinophaga fulva]NML37267.1 O-antigen ligase family protein [Chitinophaga fulva]